MVEKIILISLILQSVFIFIFFIFYKKNVFKNIKFVKI